MGVFGVEPQSASGHIPLLSVASRKLTVACLSARPATVYTHWDSDEFRTYPCLGAQCGCVQVPRKRIFRAYFVGGDPGKPNESLRHFIIELTQSAYQCLVKDHLGHVDWLGSIVEIWRTGSHKQARCEAQVLRRVEGVRPSVIDVEACLYRIWGYSPPESNSMESES